MRALAIVLFVVGCGPPTPTFSMTTPTWATVVARAAELRLAAEWDRARAMVNDALRSVPDANGKLRLLVERAAIEREIDGYRKTDGLATSSKTLAEAEALVAGASPDVRAALAEERGWNGYSKAFDGKTTFDAVRASFDEARALREQVGDTTGVAMTWFEIGLTYQFADRLNDARDAFARGLALAEQTGAKVAQGYLQRHLGFVEGEIAKDPAIAIPYYEKSLALREEGGHQWGIVFAATALADAVAPTDQARARELLARAIAVATELVIPRGAAQAHEAMSILDNDAGDATSACVQLAAAVAAWTTFGDTRARGDAAARQAELGCLAP